MKRTPFRWFALSCLLGIAGCLVPYCARSINQLPPVELNCDPHEVHAFTVSITRQTVRDEGIKERWELREVTPEANKTPTQSRTSYNFGIFAISPGTAPGFLIDTTHVLNLRLYRAGFKTVEVDMVDPQAKVVWERADDAAMRETALDNLFGLAPVIVAKGEPKVERLLQPGSKSPEHLAALKFGVAQYTALVVAMGDPTRDDLKELKTRLAIKAARLQALADAAILVKKGKKR